MTHIAKYATLCMNTEDIKEKAMEDKTVLEVLREIVEERMPDAPEEAKQGYMDAIKWFMLSA